MKATKKAPTNGKAAPGSVASRNGGTTPEAASPAQPKVPASKSAPAQPQLAPDVEQAYGVLTSALDAATQRGAFNLDQAANVAQALGIVWRSLPRR